MEYKTDSDYESDSDSGNDFPFKSKMTMQELQEHIDNGMPKTKGVTSKLVGLGRLDLLRKAYRLGYPLDEFCSDIAAEKGRLDIIMWLASKDAPWGCSLYYMAAEHGHIDIMEFAYENGCEFDKDEYIGCREHNSNLEILMWEHKMGVPKDGHVCCNAVYNGQLDVLKWAHFNGYPISASCCSVAAREGHLEVLKWLRSKGCPWDSMTCSEAAGGGHLNVLKWAHENGCVWNEGTYTEAWYRRDYNKDIFEYVTKNECPSE